MTPLYAGVDVGGSSIRTVVASADGTVLSSDRRPTPRRFGPDEVPVAIAASVHATIASADCEAPDVVAVGIGVPGQVDQSAGTVGNAATLPDWPTSLPLAEIVSQHVGRPVFIENDVRLAVAVERVDGVGLEFPSFLGVYLGTGVGAGVVLDGALWEGRGNAGEFGHTVVDFTPEARLCACGRRGCLEAYAGRGGMEAAARRAVEAGRGTMLFDVAEFRDVDRLTGDVWANALAARDPLTVDLVADAVAALGAAIGSTVNLLDVDGVVLGGGLAADLGPDFLGSVAEATAERILAGSPPPIRAAARGDLAGAVGAAALAQDRHAPEGEAV